MDTESSKVSPASTASTSKIRLSIMSLVLTVISGVAIVCWRLVPSSTVNSAGLSPAQVGIVGDDPTSKAVRCETDWSEQLLAAVRQYQSSVKNFQDAGGAEAAGIQSREQIDERLALLKRMDEDNQSLLKIVRGAVAAIKSCLVAVGWPEDKAAEEAQSAAGAAKVNYLAAIRAEDASFCASARATLLFLKKNWGAWKYEAAEKSITFDNNDLLEQHRLLVAKINEAAQRSAQLQARALNNQSSPSAADRPQ